MEARPDPAHTPARPASRRAPTRSAIAPEELRAILSNLSHEICRPLISLRAGIDLLLGDDGRSPSADRHRHLETMAGLCDKMIELTQSYLDYAALAQGARPLRYGSYTIGALIGEVDRQFAAAAAARGIAWECGLAGADAAVATDASRCQQLFANLVGNALKYTPGGGRVRVTARREGARWWSVVVADTGPGIPDDTLDRVFEPFYRLPRDERSGVEGNGLGLAICREVADSLGGGVTLGPEPDGGTRAVVRLPIGAARDRAAAESGDGAGD